MLEICNYHTIQCHRNWEHQKHHVAAAHIETSSVQHTTQDTVSAQHLYPSSTIDRQRQLPQADNLLNINTY